MVSLSLTTKRSFFTCLGRDMNRNGCWCRNSISIMWCDPLKKSSFCCFNHRTICHELLGILLVFLPVIVIPYCPSGWTKWLQLSGDPWNSDISLTTWEFTSCWLWRFDGIVVIFTLIVMSCWRLCSNVSTHKRPNKHFEQRSTAQR